MNADEVRIIDFLSEFPDEFVSSTDVSKRLGKGRRFRDDRNWAAPIMRRMEMDGFLESNDSGSYRVRMDEPPQKEDKPGKQAKQEKQEKQEKQPIDFKQALKTPGVSLGDTTIIRITDVQEQGKVSRNRAVR
jgi:hypothetical protein